MVQCGEYDHRGLSSLVEETERFNRHDCQRNARDAARLQKKEAEAE